VINVSISGRSAPGRRSSEESSPEEFFRPRRGLGSGVIIDPSGIALTNAHVVEGGQRVDVTLSDGTKQTARVLGVDKKTDLAVLQIDAQGKTFPYVPLGDSDESQVGDWVMAVGSPFGLQATVTSGIISAKARQIGAGPYDDFIQTDAAINPGNSGGPLVNMRGEVIGINTAIVRGGAGIGFAIPSNMARRVASELRTSGKVTRGYLGVSLQPLTADLATSFGITDTKGALVSEVSPDGPAAHAGLKSGDVVVEFNGQKVDDPSALARAVAVAKPGETGRVTIVRDRQQRTVDIKLGEMPAERVAAGPGGESGAGRNATTSQLGMAVQPVTPEIARELDLKEPSGVVVSRVDPSSAAGQAGIERGDVIVEVDRKPVKSLEDFERATAAAKGKSVLFRVQRNGGSVYIALAPSTN
jgi:serine protease Do